MKTLIIFIISSFAFAQMYDPNEPEDSVISITYPEKEFVLRFLKNPKKDCYFAVFSNRTDTHLWVHSFKNQKEITKFLELEDKLPMIQSIGEVIEVPNKIIQKGSFTLLNSSLYLKHFENSRERFTQISPRINCSL